MRASNSLFLVILNAVKDRVFRWKRQSTVFLQEKLKTFFEVLMLLFFLLIFPLFFTYLSDINNNKQTSNFFLTYPQAFHNSKMFHFRRCFHVAWC